MTRQFSIRNTLLVLFYGLVILYAVAEFPYKPLTVIYEGF